MSRKTSLLIVLVLVGVFVALVFVFVAERRTPVTTRAPIAQPSLAVKTVANHSALAHFRPVAAASVENAESRRRDAATRDLQAGRAASLEIVSTIYGPLLAKLNVSSEVRKQFLDLVGNERQAAYDVVATANRENLDYLSNPEVQRMALAAATSEDARIHDLLPAADFEQFVDYRNMRPIQLSISRVMDNLAESGGAPLSDAEVQALIKVFYEAQTPGQLSRAPINAVLNLRGVGITEPIVSAARSVLSEQQLAALLAVRAAQAVPTHDRIGSPSARPGGGH